MLNYIFDLDGTIINSSNEVMKCFKEAFHKSNYQINEQRLNSDVIGPPLKDIIKLIAPELSNDNKINEIIENFRKIYDYEEHDISQLYDGIYLFLNELKENGKNLFMATFKPYKPTQRIIKQFNLNMFKDVYTIDKFGKHITKTEMIENIITKYNLKKEETVMIGDAHTDVIAGKNAGVTAIGVLWGYGSDKTALIKNSDFTVSTIEELKNIKPYQNI